MVSFLNLEVHELGHMCMVKDAKNNQSYILYFVSHFHFSISVIWSYTLPLPKLKYASTQIWMPLFGFHWFVLTLQSCPDDKLKEGIQNGLGQSQCKIEEWSSSLVIPLAETIKLNIESPKGYHCLCLDSTSCLFLNASAHPQPTATSPFASLKNHVWKYCSLICCKKKNSVLAEKY
jgi:hypothetical protein